MVQDFVQQLTAAETLRLCGLDPALSQPGESSDAEGWLSGFLESLAGKRSYDSVIEALLRGGREDEALRVSARAHERQHPMSAGIAATLESVWLRWAKDYEEDRAVIHRLLADTADSAAGFEDDRRDAIDRFEALPELGSRPATTTRLEAAITGRAEARLLRGDVEALAEILAIDAKARTTRLIVAAQKAMTSIVERLDSPGAHRDVTEAVLRAIPELVLRRRLELLERIADGTYTEVPLTAIASPERRARAFATPVRATGLTSMGSVSSLQLAAISETLLAQAPPGRNGLTTGEDIKRFDHLLGLGVSHAEVGDYWLGIAKTTTGQPLRLPAIGRGLLAWGREYLKQEQLRFAGEVLRDAAACLASSPISAQDGSFDDCAHALVLTKAWPAYLSSAPARTARLRLAEWSSTPDLVYSWIVKAHNIHIIASAWVELTNDAAAARFLEVATARTALPDELIRECATGLVNPFLLRTRPRQTLDRLRALLEPHVQSSALLHAMDDVGQQLEDVNKGTSPAIATRVLSQQLTEIRVGLEELRARVPLFEEVTELLPGLLNSLLERLVPLAEPKVSVLPLIGALFPEERSSEITIPVLISNAEGAAPAPDVSVQLAVADAASLVTIPPEQRERPIGTLESGAEHQVGFVADASPKLVHQATQVRLRVQVRSGKSTLYDSHFTIGIKPGDRSQRQNPYPTGKRVPPEQFIGRESELRQVVESVLGIKQDRTPIVVGIRRIGKTSLLYKVEADPEIKRRFYCSQVDLEDRPKSETTDSFLIYLTERIRDSLPQPFRGRLHFSRQEFRDEPYAAFERFGDELNALSLQRRVLLIIDEIDKLMAIIRAGQERETGAPLGPTQVLQPEVLGALRKMLMKDGAVRMIFAGLPSFLEAGYTDRLFGLFLPVHLKPFTEDEATKVLAGSEGVLNLTRRAREYLFRATGLQPYLLNLACYFLFAAAATSGRDLTTLADVEEIIDDKLLSSESYFTDYVSLAGNALPVVRAVAAAERGTKMRRYVSLAEILRELRRSGDDIDQPSLQAILEDLSQRDRPLLQRAPNAADRFQTVIGMLGEHLLRRAAR